MGKYSFLNNNVLKLNDVRKQKRDISVGLVVRDGNDFVKNKEYYPKYTTFEMLWYIFNKKDSMQKG